MFTQPWPHCCLPRYCSLLTDPPDWRTRLTHAHPLLPPLATLPLCLRSQGWAQRQPWPVRAGVPHALRPGCGWGAEGEHLGWAAGVELLGVELLGVEQLRVRSWVGQLGVPCGAKGVAWEVQ